MRGTSIKLTLDRADLGVTVVDSKADIFSTIVDVKTPAGVDYILSNRTPMVIKLADGSNVPLTRNGEIIIGFMGAGDTLVKELYRWDYGVFYDLDIAEQRNKNYRDQVAISMPWPFAIAREDEHFIIQVKHATVVDISQANNIIEFNVNKAIIA